MQTARWRPVFVGGGQVTPVCHPYQVTNIYICLVVLPRPCAQVGHRLRFLS